MSTFIVELNTLEKSADLFRDKCSKHIQLQTFCFAIFADIRQQLDEIIEDHEILMHMNHDADQSLLQKRAATSLLPFVGTLARGAFGTLDESYARDMETMISELHKDDKHLLNLISNQTTVLETFLQQARLSEERSKQQYEWMHANLNVLENAIQHNIVENEINMRLQFLSSHIISRTQHLFSTQSAMI